VTGGDRLRAVSGGVVISQVSGGGGNTGAQWKNDFIELFNRGASPVNLSGMSVQYASSTGSTWAVTALPAVTLAPGQYFLVQEAAGAGAQPNLPTPDASGTIAMAAGAGKVFHHTAGFNPPDQWDEFQLQEFDDPWYRRLEWYPWNKKEPNPKGHPFNGLDNFQGEAASK